MKPICLIKGLQGYKDLSGRRIPVLLKKVNVSLQFKKQFNFPENVSYIRPKQNVLNKIKTIWNEYVTTTSKATVGEGFLFC